jgi:hypothetical protein
MEKGRVFLALTICLLVMAGCGLRFHVNVDSINSGNISAKDTYILLPGNKDISVDDLQFREYADYVIKALNSQGYRLAESFDEAGIAIFLAYGIGDPQDHQFTYSVPVMGQTGVSSATTYGTMSSYGGYGTYSGYTTYTPSYGITGYIPYSGTRRTYFRFMMLDAYDLNSFRNNEKTLQLWRTTTTSRGSSGDLRRVFPILVAASKPYIGTNTGQQVKIILREKDNAVLEIKGIAPRSKKAGK